MYVFICIHIQTPNVAAFHIQGTFQASSIPHFSWLFYTAPGDKFSGDTEERAAIFFFFFTAAWQPKQNVVLGVSKIEAHWHVMYRDSLG